MLAGECASAPSSRLVGPGVAVKPGTIVSRKALDGEYGGVVGLPADLERPQRLVGAGDGVVGAGGAGERARESLFAEAFSVAAGGVQDAVGVEDEDRASRDVGTDPLPARGWH